METILSNGQKVRIIDPAAVEDAVARLFVQANYALTKDVTGCIRTPRIPNAARLQKACSAASSTT